MTPDRQRAAYYERHDVAEREFLAHAAGETGRGISAEDYERQIQAKARTREQTEQLAQRLTEAGKIAFGGDLMAVARWWVHSRKLELIPQYRRICLLPYVAAIVRASKLAALEFFLQRNRFCRFWTFTSGVRCGLDELRARCAYLHRRLSRLSAFLRERYGVELVFRSTEFGTLEFDEHGNRTDGGAVEFGADGEPLFHVHAHCVVHSLVGYIAPPKWKLMIEAVWEFWEHNWDADGVIRDARECCKYVTKPGDLLALSPAQLGQMHEAVFRMKLCQPMGALAQEIRDRRDNPAGRKVLRRYRKTGGGSEWREVFDHNEQAPQTVEEREAADNHADAERFAEECAAASRVDVPDRYEAVQVGTHWKDGSEPVRTVEIRSVPGGFCGAPVRDRESADFCRVLSRLSPSVGPSGRKEPCVVVGFTRFDAEKVTGHPLVSRLWAQTVQQWEDAAPRFEGVTAAVRNLSGVRRGGTLDTRGGLPRGSEDAGASVAKEAPSKADCGSADWLAAFDARAARISLDTGTPTVPAKLGTSHLAHTGPPFRPPRVAEPAEIKP